MKIRHKITLTLAALSLSLTGSYAQHFEEANDPQPAHLITPANQINKTQCINRFLATLPDYVSEQTRNTIRTAALRHNTLQLHDLGLGTLDGPTLGALTWLQELNLSNNKLRELPEQLSHLKSLSYLDISKNGFVDFPLVVTQLYNLKELYVGNELEQDDNQPLRPNFRFNNSFRTLPSEIGHLQRLKKMFLNMGSLTYLPDEIGSLINLEELRLSVNRLRHLPSSIGRLRQLKGLYLQLNPLEELPQEIIQLRNLRDLTVSFTHPTTLPIGLREFPYVRLILVAEDEILPEGGNQGLGIRELTQIFGADKFSKGGTRLIDAGYIM